MKNNIILGLLALCTILSSCSYKRNSGFGTSDRWAEHETIIYKNEELLKQLDPNRVIIAINLKSQLATIYQDYQEVLVTRCSTGVRGNTPKGTFKITEKIREGKRSNIFGTLFDDSYNPVFTGDRRYYEGSYSSYIGHEMKNWQRLSNLAVGIHFSNNIWRYPASGGCIRIGWEASEIFYKATQKGTEVLIN